MQYISNLHGIHTRMERGQKGTYFYINESGSSRDAIRQSAASDTTTGNIASISSRIKSNLNPLNASLPHKDIDSKCTIGLMDSSYPVYDIETELKDFLVPNEPHFVIPEPTSKPYIQGVPALKSLALTQLFSSDQNDSKKLGSIMEEIDNTTTLWNQEIPRSSVEKKNESQLINIPINSISTLPLEIHNDITRPLTVDTNVEVDKPAAGSLNECGVCGPSKAIWVPTVSETGEPLIESSTSGHGQTIKIDPVDTFWIQCDVCEKWYHGSCAGIEEFEDALIDKFHCGGCVSKKGPTIMKEVLVHHRLAFDDLSQKDRPVEVGTKTWIEQFITIEKNIPAPTSEHVTICENGFEFMEIFDRKNSWKKVFLIQYARGLELRMPDDDDNFTLKSVVDIFGGSHKVDTIDVYRQMTHSMSLGAFYEKMTKRDRPRLYNILSLEFSQNEKMRQYVAPPILVPEISFVHRLWPDRNDPVNWDSDMDYLPSSMKVRQIVEVLEEHRLNKPEVALFCLAGMGGSYTDFHIDFGGSSVWYHIYKGQKIFYIVEPTEENLALFEQYQKSETKTETFLGDLLPDGALRRVVIEQGQTLMIPSGWIHAVYTPVDSLVFGGNFLHALNIPMQLRVYDMELRLKAEVGTEEKFLFPHFELVNWYAARSFILEHIREANDEGNSADDYMMESARALLPRLKEWMKRDKEDKNTITQGSFNDVLVKLQKEVKRQERLRKSISPRQSPMKKAKKRKSFDNIETANGNNLNLEGNYEGDNITEASPCIKLRIPRPPSCTEIHNIPSPSPPHSRSTSPSDFSLKLTKKGNKYTSAVVEKSSPIVNGVQLAHMFAYRSSSGRTPRPSKWLDHAAGEEIKRKTLELEAAGMMNKPREPITYDAEMERAIAEEEREFIKEAAKKKRRGSKKAIHSVDLGKLEFSGSKKKPTTAKQRLATRMKMKF